MTVTSVTPDTWKAFHTRVLERVAALPGVRRAAFVWGLPLTGNKWPGTMELVGQPGSERLTDQLSVPLRSVTPDYFEVMGVHLMDALVRREVHAVDPTAAVEHATTMAEIRRASLAPRTFAMRLLIGFSVLATSLAWVGIYGVLSLSVGSRVKRDRGPQGGWRPAP